MPNLNCLIIEDNEVTAKDLVALLKRIGFDSVVISTLDEYNDSPFSTGEPLLDLIVVDRQIPLSPGAPANHELGPIIFEQLARLYSDTPIYHLTGHHSFEHLRKSKENRPKLCTGNDSQTMDSVHYFKKSELLEFEESVTSLKGTYDEIDDLYLDVKGQVSLGKSEARVLRRIVRSLDGAGMTAQSLDGGLSSAAVYSCVVDLPGLPSRRFIAKISTKPRPAPALELSTTASAMIVTPLMEVRGLAYGRRAVIYQLAGVETTSLMESIGRDALQASIIADTVLKELSTDVQSRYLPVSDLIRDLICWDNLATVAKRHGVILPNSTKKIRSNQAVQHGDLHPGNILINDNKPSIIDLDSSGVMASVSDPMTLLLGAVFHKESPFREKFSEFDAALVIRDIRNNNIERIVLYSPTWFRDWFASIAPHIASRKASDLEVWAFLLGYAGRNLQYDDVLKDVNLSQFTLALLSISAEKLSA